MTLPKININRKTLLSIFKAFSITVILATVIYSIGYLFSDKPENVRITNIGSNSFTVSWTTKSPTEGVVYYSTNQITKSLPSPLLFLGTNKAYDERDVSAYEIKKVTDENAIFEQGKYYTHSVTLKGLEFSNKYYFQIGNNVFAWGGTSLLTRDAFLSEGSSLDELAITTLPLSNLLLAPDPSFGKVINSDGTPAKDKMITIWFINRRQMEIPLAHMLSTVTGENGDYYFDLSNAKSYLTGEPAQLEETEDILQIITVVDQKGIRNEQQIPLTLNAPVGDIFLSDEYTSQLSIEQVFSRASYDPITIESHLDSSLSIQKAFAANDCTGKNCGAGSCFTGPNPNDGGWGCTCNGYQIGPNTSPKSCPAPVPPQVPINQPVAPVAPQASTTNDCTNKNCGAGSCFTGPNPNDGGWGCSCTNGTTIWPDSNQKSCPAPTGGNSGTGGGGNQVPPVSATCGCTGGVDTTGASITIASTSCGSTKKFCGGNNIAYVCNGSGSWQRVADNCTGAYLANGSLASSGGTTQVTSTSCPSNLPLNSGPVQYVSKPYGRTCESKTVNGTSVWCCSQTVTTPAPTVIATVAPTVPANLTCAQVLSLNCHGPQTQSINLPCRCGQQGGSGSLVGTNYVINCTNGQRYTLPTCGSTGNTGGSVSTPTPTAIATVAPTVPANLTCAQVLSLNCHGPQTQSINLPCRCGQQGGSGSLVGTNYVINCTNGQRYTLPTCGSTGNTGGSASTPTPTPTATVAPTQPAQTNDCTGKTCGEYGSCITGPNANDGGWGCSCNNGSTIQPNTHPYKMCPAPGTSLGCDGNGGCLGGANGNTCVYNGTVGTSQYAGQPCYQCLNGTWGLANDQNKCRVPTQTSCQPNQTLHRDSKPSDYTASRCTGGDLGHSGTSESGNKFQYWCCNQYPIACPSNLPTNSGLTDRVNRPSASCQSIRLSSGNSWCCPQAIVATATPTPTPTPTPLVVNQSRAPICEGADYVLMSGFAPENMVCNRIGVGTFPQCCTNLNRLLNPTPLPTAPQYTACPSCNSGNTNTTPTIGNVSINPNYNTNTNLNEEEIAALVDYLKSIPTAPDLPNCPTDAQIFRGAGNTANYYGFTECKSNNQRERYCTLGHVIPDSGNNYHCTPYRACPGDSISLAEANTPLDGPFYACMVVGNQTSIMRVGCDAQIYARRTGATISSFVCGVGEGEPADLPSSSIILPQLRDSTNSSIALLDSIIPRVASQTAAVNNSVIILDDKYILFPQEGVYSYKYNGKTYTITIDEATKARVFLDDNKNNEKDSSEKYLDQVATIKQVEIESVTKTYSYVFKPGYNFVSFPFVFGEESNQASELLATLKKNGNFVLVSQYDGGWKTITSTDSSTPSGNAFAIQPGKGYVIRLLQSEPATVRFTGFPIKESATVSLTRGWNLIGVYNPNKPYLATTLISGILKKNVEAINVTKFDDALYSGIQIEGDKKYGFDFPIEYNKGYFINVRTLPNTNDTSYNWKD